MAETAFFSEVWVDRLVNAWNETSLCHGKLAGAGAVVFQLAHTHEPRSFGLFWDDAGRLTRLHTDAGEQLPRFEAPEAEWRSFINGEYSAVAGVLAGRIKYRGKMSFAFKYGPYFDNLAAIAKDI